MYKNQGAGCDKKNKMAKGSSYFKLFYFNNDNFLQEIPYITADKISTILYTVKKIVKHNKKLILLLFEDGTLIDDDEYLCCNSGIKLLVCTEKEKDSLIGYFLLKRFQISQKS